MPELKSTYSRSDDAPLYTPPTREDMKWELLAAWLQQTEDQQNATIHLLQRHAA